jgi:transcriptional regulator with XRE-family HTH domain
LQTKHDFAKVYFVLFNRYALTEARKKKNLTRSGLAKAANHSAPYITQVEQGDRPSPSMEAIERWCEVLDVEDPRALFIEPTMDELVKEMGAARDREARAS